MASLGGNATLTAGNKYTQTASDVLAQAGDIGIVAKDVLINTSDNTTHGTEHASYSKTAIGATVDVPVVDALKSVSGMVQAAKNTSDTRMKALAALNAAGTIKDAPTSIDAIEQTGVRVSLSLGSSKSESDTVTSSTTAVGAQVKAGGNVSIVATGAGQQSNLTAIGSDISAGNNVSLSADNAVNLLAAQNTDSQHSTNKSSGNSIGVGFGVGGTSNGFTIDLAVSRGRGNADGDDVSYTNTHVSAGNKVSLLSGSDTTLRGGVISGNNVTADIGGNLNIESLQDRSTYESKQTSAGLNASLCIPPMCFGVSTVGGSFSKSNVNGNYLSVLEQSGIKTGDGGFQVAVAGNTDLIGGVLSSTQAAIDQNKNLLNTGSLTSSDLQNKDEHSASGLSLSGSVSATLGGQTTLPDKLTEAQRDAARADGKPGASGGFGSVSGSQGSVTASGISGGAVVINDQAKQLATGKDADAVLASVDRSVTTDSSKNAASALTKDWDAQQLQKDVDAQVAITQAFSVQAPKAIAKFADDKIKELTEQHASPEEIAKWEEGGEYRVALHTVSGGLLGGLGGALGSGVVAGSAKQLDLLQTNAEASLVEQGLSPQAAKAAAQAFGEITSLGIGSVVGGGAGSAAAIATDANNRQFH
nr:hemagglutinin repeat-containing protein [Massilia sp. 9096]